MRWKWPDEVIEWLRDNVPGRTTKEVTVLINQQGFDEKYGMVFTESSVKGAKNRYKIQSGTPCGIPKGTPSDVFPAEVRAYIQENHQGVGPKDMTEKLNAEFGTKYTREQIKGYYSHYKINSGLTGYFPKGNVPHSKGKKMSAEQYEKCKATMFKKGQIPPNHMEVGEYTHTTDGYLVRKISETGTQWERWEFVHRATWGKHNGPIPPGKMVSFLDGDKDNCSIENLILIDNFENLELNRSKLRFENPEHTRVGVAVAKVKIAARARKRGAKSDN